MKPLFAVLAVMSFVSVCAPTAHAQARWEQRRWQDVDERWDTARRRNDPYANGQPYVYPDPYYGSPEEEDDAEALRAERAERWRKRRARELTIYPDDGPDMDTRPVRRPPLPPRGQRWDEQWDDDQPRAQPRPRPRPHDQEEAREPLPQDDGDGEEQIVKDGGPRPAIAAKAPPVVPFNGIQRPGSIVIEVNTRKLYFVLPGGRAYQYPIAVGREGFSWTGTEKVSRIAEWPDWHPPAEMRERQPELPHKMLGGLNNPLGAKAIYLGNTLYRIHGTNDAKSIGRAQSSGCFRMLNAHVVHLAAQVQVGAEVTVVHKVTPTAGLASAGRARLR